jgi:hypothetical protein
MSGSVKVVNGASPPLVQGPRTFDGDLVILPHDLDGDRGIYSDQLTTTVKTLRAEGIDARWLHDADHRLWDGKRSAVVDLWIIPFIVGIFSSAGWTALTALVRRRTGPVKLKIGYRKDPSGSEERWIELEGNSADVAAELERLNPWQSPEMQSDRAEAAPNNDPEPRTADEWYVYQREARINSLRQQARRLYGKSSLQADIGTPEAESVARTMLAIAASAFWNAEDTELESVTHREMDDYGRWVRTTFGCHLTYESGTYHQRCPVAIAHKRVGMSMGFTVRQRICSICGDDWADCPHSPKELYDVPGGLDEKGKCHVCAAEHCAEHLPGQTYRTPPIAIVTEIEDLHEVSFVRKPAQPDARPTSFPVDTTHLDPSFEPGTIINCNRCIRPCEGIEEIPGLTLSGTNCVSQRGALLPRIQAKRGVSAVPCPCQNGRKTAVISGHPRAPRMAFDLGMHRLTRCVKHTSKQPVADVDLPYSSRLERRSCSRQAAGW